MSIYHGLMKNLYNNNNMMMIIYYSYSRASAYVIRMTAGKDDDAVHVCNVCTRRHCLRATRLRWNDEKAWSQACSAQHQHRPDGYCSDR